MTRFTVHVLNSLQFVSKNAIGFCDATNPVQIAIRGMTSQNAVCFTTQTTANLGLVRHELFYSIFFILNI